MIRHPWKRLLAWLIDWLCVLVWVAIVAAVGIPLHLAGFTGTLPPLWLNVIAAVTVVVPAALLLASLESGARQASLGKRVLRLRVVTLPNSERPSFARAVTRNALKVAVPWTIGHAAVYEIVATSATNTMTAATVLLTMAAYALPLAYVISLFVGRGRTPYDYVSGTAVMAAPPRETVPG